MATHDTALFPALLQCPVPWLRFVGFKRITTMLTNVEELSSAVIKPYRSTTAGIYPLPDLNLSVPKATANQSRVLTTIQQLL